MSTEIVDIYDENLQRIGSIPRDEAHATGAWHRSIHVWIVKPSGAGYVLFQKRGKDKKLFPNCLDITAAGHYRAGETAREGVREVLEELGLPVDYSELIPLGVKMDVAKVGDTVNREFDDVFLLLKDLSPKDYQLDPAEVEGLVQVEVDEGLALFGGDSDTARAIGIEWDRGSGGWADISLTVTSADFIPRIDPYYYKVFILAKAAIAGSKHLAI